MLDFISRLCYHIGSMKQLNDNQQAFCEEYVKNGFKGTQAYRIVYNQDKNQVCSSESYKMLRDPRIQEEINNIMLSFRIVGFEEGIEKKTIMRALAGMLKAKKPLTKDGHIVDEIPDYQAINNAINTYAKLTGDFAAEKKDVNVTGISGAEDIKKMTPEERQEYKDALLKQL